MVLYYGVSHWELEQEMNVMFKICTIGCGNMAKTGHGPSYKKYAMLNPDISLEACCDLDEKKASFFQKSFGFKKYYTDIVDMLETEKPDAVCLIAPEHLTAGLSTMILEKGYPLLMEKPPGLNCEETLSMIDAAKISGVPNQVAFNRRYMPLVRELKRQIENTCPHNDIQHIRYDFYRVNRKDSDFAATAIHGIDTVKYLAGSDYSKIRFRYQEFPELGPNVANIFMECTFASGTTAYISFCPVAGVIIERAAVNSYNHTFFLNLPVWEAMDSPGRLTHMAGGKIQLDVTGDDISDGSEMFETNGFYGENAAFFDALRNGLRPSGDIASGLQSVEIADYIRKRISIYSL
jgi:myo-inositol 2-dehydrogenase / D-chiro-inositol 1-dehydrogenase